MTSTTRPDSDACSAKIAMTSGEDNDSGSTLTVMNVFGGSIGRASNAERSVVASSSAATPCSCDAANHTSGPTDGPMSKRVNASNPATAHRLRSTIG